MVAMQIAREPLVRHVLRQTFQERAKINIKPTKKGKKVGAYDFLQSLLRYHILCVLFCCKLFFVYLLFCCLTILIKQRVYAELQTTNPCIICIQIVNLLVLEL